MPLTTSIYSAKNILNPLIALVLLAGIGLRSLFPMPIVRSQEYEAAKLAEFLQDRLIANGHDFQRALAQSQEIEILSPSDGTLYEKGEKLTLRWSFSGSIDTVESYVVTVAYYESGQISIPLEPTVQSFSTKGNVLQLPSLNIDDNIPVVAWSVYAQTGDANPVSKVYKLLRAYYNPAVSGYHIDNGF